MDLDFDLNLLRVLAALDQTRSVTRAADYLEMSQSGFSTALGRLREQVGDPLFVRTALGMEPTPRARRMITSAQNALAEVQVGILDPPIFDPASSTTEFKLAMADVAETVFLPRLLCHLQQVAPRSRVSCGSYASTALHEAMQAGEVDLALGYFPDLSEQAFFQQRLYTHTYACMIRRGHPLQSRPMTEEDYSATGHAVVSSPARSNDLFEQFLLRRGIERRVVLRTPHHLTLPAIVEATDLLATVPLATGARFARLGTLDLVRLPFKPPVFAIQQHWHRLYHHEPRNCWLRAQVAMLFNEATDEWFQTEADLYGDELRKRTAADRPSRSGRVAKTSVRKVRSSPA